MAFRYVRNIWSVLTQNANNDVWLVTDTGVPTALTGAGMLGPGSRYIDLATGIMYTNIGTKAVPSWINPSSAVAGLGGLGAVGNAKMTYDFTVDGGAIGSIIPANSPTIPLAAIILGGTIDITVALTSGGAATIAVGLGSGAQAAALKAATAVATYTIGQMAVIPVFTAATYYKATAAAQLSLTVAAFALTAGRMDVNVVYVQGN